MFSVDKGNTKEALVSVDSNEAWTQKGSGSETYIFSSPPEAISHVLQHFYGFSNIRKSKGLAASAPIASADHNQGNQGCSTFLYMRAM